MEKIPQLPAEQAAVVLWRRSAEGIIWSLDRIPWGGRLRHHHEDSGAFAELLPDFGLKAQARMRPPDDPAFIDRGAL